jgi:signal transduction histidine kinase
MDNVVPAAIAFFALGALLMSSVLLLLLNPGSRDLRWWLLFMAANLVWLAGQGWAFATGDWDATRTLVGATVHLLPALFVAYVVGGLHRRPARVALLPVAVAAALLPVAVVHASPGAGGTWFVAGWHIGMWGLGTVLMLRARWVRQAQEGGQRRLAVAVIALLVIVGPVALVGGFTVGMRMWYYAMPLLVVWIQFLVFVGVARLRFYDIEVRAARTGEIAAGAAEAERLAVVGELAASLAHEIRNPLTGVRSLAQRLAAEEIDEPRRRRYAGVILEEVGRVERLVGNLLGIARRAPRPEPSGARTAASPLFDDLQLLVASRAERAGVRLSADAGDVDVSAPREALAQALLNLLLNAIAHTPRGGAVHLLARRGTDRVDLRVRDSGPGVPPAERERIWDPFHSGSGGTGLGLAVVRRLAREHGWTAEVGEAHGGGAEFRLHVPSPPLPPQAGGEGRGEGRFHVAPLTRH